MTKTILAAVAALGLGAGAAYAQGVPPGATPPAYGSQAFSDHSNEPQVHFLGKGTVFGKIFHHSDSDQGVASRTTATSNQGG
jgi:hypothetical protein